MKKKKLKNSRIKERSKPRSAGSKPKHFFKHTKKTSSSLRFPSILRIITEKYFLGFIVSFVLIAMLFVVGMDLYKDVLEQKKIETERKEIISKIKYWQEIVNKYNDYRDAYFQLAILEYRLKNFDKAKSYLSKTLSIDPNFEKGRELEKILDIK